MYATLNPTAKGLAPLLLKNGSGANPLDPLVKELKRWTSKRKKTDQDYEIIAQLEWLGSFYPSEPGTFEVKNGKLIIEGFGVPVIPGENVEGMLVKGARKLKKGDAFKAGIVCEGVYPIVTGANGKTKTIREMLGDPNHFFTHRAVIQGKTVMRTRPIFNRWQISPCISYLPSEVDKQEVEEVFELCGRVIGLGDWRPRFGRFEAVTE